MREKKEIETVAMYVYCTVCTAQRRTHIYKKRRQFFIITYSNPYFVFKRTLMLCSHHKIGRINARTTRKTKQRKGERVKEDEKQIQK